MSVDTVNVDVEVLCPNERQAVISLVASNIVARCITERDRCKENKYDETQRVRNAVQGLRQVVVEAAHPHYQKPFEYDSFMEKMMAKAKNIKKKK